MYLKCKKYEKKYENSNSFSIVLGMVRCMPDKNFRPIRPFFTQDLGEMGDFEQTEKPEKPERGLNG